MILSGGWLKFAALGCNIPYNFAALLADSSRFCMMCPSSQARTPG